MDESIGIRRMSKLFTSLSGLARSKPSAKLVVERAPRPRCIKEYDDVASARMLDFIGGSVLGMWNDEWDASAQLCTIISSRYDRHSDLASRISRTRSTVEHLRTVPVL